MFGLWAAAAPPATDPGWVSYLGPFIPFAVLALWGLGWLMRQLKIERDARVADAEKHAAALAEKDRRIEALSERVVESAERFAPLLADASNALSEAARELARRPRT